MPHRLERYGSVVNVMEKDGFEIAARVCGWRENVTWLKQRIGLRN